MKKIFCLFVVIMITGYAVLNSQEITKEDKIEVTTIEIIAPADEEVIQEEPVFVVAEENAMFQGGDLNKFREWVQKNLVNPEIALENSIQGKIYIQFNVTSKGKVVDAKILRGVDPSLDNEAVRVVMSSPAWEPVIANESSAPCLIHLIPH